MSNKDSKKDDKPEPKSLWNSFLDRYPNADLSKFKHGVDSYDKEPFVRFVGRHGSEYEVFDKSKFMYSLYFPDEMKKALGLPVDFPLELTLNPKPSLPIYSRDRFRREPYSQFEREVEEIEYLRNANRLFLCTRQRHILEYND